MNIFVTSPDPKESAIALDDRRLIKMCLESCQIMSTVMHSYGAKGPYKPTHANHPCTKWAGINNKNFDWLRLHAACLCEEYNKRFKKHHACYNYVILEFTEFLFHSNKLPRSYNMTEFVNCTPFKHIKDVHEAYRQCLLDKWQKDKRFPKWTGRPVPEWAGTITA